MCGARKVYGVVLSTAIILHSCTLLFIHLCRHFQDLITLLSLNSLEEVVNSPTSLREKRFLQIYTGRHIYGGVHITRKQLETPFSKDKIATAVETCKAFGNLYAEIMFDHIIA